MKELDLIFEAYKQVLLAHIQTKTTESVFHKKSEEFYELLFDCFHLISEKRQDIELDEPWNESLMKETYDNIELVKWIVEKLIWQKNSHWMDNLLRWLIDKLEGACWDARAFVEEEKEEIKEKYVLKPKK